MKKMQVHSLYPTKQYNLLKGWQLERKSSSNWRIQVLEFLILFSSCSHSLKTAHLNLQFKRKNVKQYHHSFSKSKEGPYYQRLQSNETLFWETHSTLQFWLSWIIWKTGFSSYWLLVKKKKQTSNFKEKAGLYWVYYSADYCSVQASGSCFCLP